MEILFSISIVLLTGTLAAAQDNHIRNFQVDSQTSTDITFSWDIADDYYNSTYISYFRLYYQSRSSGYTSTVYITLSSTSQNGPNFLYTTSLETFGNNNEEYIMWIRVYRSSSLNPIYTYSERTYVNIDKMHSGEVKAVLEFKMYLWPSQTCTDFVGTSTSASTQAGTEVNWILLKSCQCALPYDFTVEDGDFTCASGYVVYRAKLSTYHNPSLDLTSLIANLTNFLTRQDSKTRITINGRVHLVDPGPCGLTVPSLDAPHCFSDSSAITSSSLSHSDVTVIAIVASVCGAVLLLMFSGCIIILVMKKRKMNGRSFGTAAVKSPDALEMTIQKHVDVPQGRACNYAYANTVATQPNPCYEDVYAN